MDNGHNIGIGGQYVGANISVSAKISAGTISVQPYKTYYKAKAYIDVIYLKNIFINDYIPIANV